MKFSTKYEGTYLTMFVATECLVCQTNIKSDIRNSFPQYHCPCMHDNIKSYLYLRSRIHNNAWIYTGHHTRSVLKIRLKRAQRTTQQARKQSTKYLHTFVPSKEGTKVVYEGKSYLRTFVSNTFVTLKGAFESCLIGVGSLSAHKRTLTPPR